MKHILSLLVFCFVDLAVADHLFIIGTEQFQFECMADGLSESFQSFVAEDITRVFAPLRSITNVLNIAAVQTNPAQPHTLIFHEWYPEGFVGGWSVTNRSGIIVFQMKQTLLNRYMDAYDNFSSISNKFAELQSIMDEINNCAITNRTDTESMSLIFLPEESTCSLSPTNARNFLNTLVQNRPFSVSVLDCWTESIRGVPCTIAASKTAILEAGNWVFTPIEWIYRDGTWKFYHPSVWETVPLGD